MVEGDDVHISVREGYLAMFYFMSSQYHSLESEEIGALLGSMSLLDDGRPADPAVWKDWVSSVEKALAVRDGAAKLKLGEK